MKNKGFTLVELLAAITLVLVIGGIVAVTVINLINRNKGRFDDAQKYIIENATKLFMDSSNIYPVVNGANYCITLQELVNDEYLKTPVLDIDQKAVPLTNTVKVNIVAPNNITYQHCGSNCTNCE